MRAENSWGRAQNKTTKGWVYSLCPSLLFTEFLHEKIQAGRYS